MKRYLFQYEETNIGYIEVCAESEEEALDLAWSGEGEIIINKGDASIGRLIEVTD